MSTYVETFDQELFLKNVPKAIDSRIVVESPLLAKAIAAEHLIQVFITHGEKLKPLAAEDNVVEKMEGEDKSQLREAYSQTFDLVDVDGSGTLDRNELMEWLGMCGAELDLSKITEVLLKEGNLSRNRFAELMSAFAASSRREYDISGQVSSGHH